MAKPSKAPDLFDVDGVDELYELEPKSFTKSRNELAKRLRKDGDRETAAAVKKLSRPTVVAWALNQVARARSEDVEELLELGNRVRDAQNELMKGGDAAAMRRAARERRDVVRRLANAAADIAGEKHRNDAAATLEVASINPDAGAALRGGHLTKTLEPSAGFGLEGMPQPSKKARRRRRDRRTIRRLKREVRETEAAVKKAEERQRAAEQRVAEAEAAAKRARKETEKADAAHDDAVAALEAAQPES